MPIYPYISPIDDCHPTHKTEWRDSSYHEYRCVICGKYDTHNSWGDLRHPCTGPTEENDNGTN